MTLTSTFTPVVLPTLTATPSPPLTDQLFQDLWVETKVVTPAGRQFQTLRLFFKSREPAQNIKVRIFNIHNYLIKEVAVQNLGTQYLAEWDCRNNNNQVKQGIYIYQIEIKGRSYNGVFVVAK